MLVAATHGAKLAARAARADAARDKAIGAPIPSWGALLAEGEKHHRRDSARGCIAVIYASEYQTARAED